MQLSDPVAIIAVGQNKGILTDSATFSRWSKEFLELHMVALSKPMFVEQNARHPFSHIQQVARRIGREWNRYTGFVVVLPEQHFLLESNLLAFMLGEVGKPVVVMPTTQQPLQPQDEQGVTAVLFQAGVMDATQAATSELAGVFMIKSARMLPVLHTRYSAPHGATSASGMTWGRVDFGVSIDATAPQRTKERPSVRTELTPRPQLVQVEELVNSTFDQDRCSALIVYSDEPLPLTVTSMLPQHAPVLLVAGNGIHLYEDGRLNQIHQLTPSAAQAKFLWVIGQIQNADDNSPFYGVSIQKALATPVLYEVLPPTL